MLNNIQEFYNILPLIIIGGLILISLIIEMYAESSEKIYHGFPLSGFYLPVFIHSWKLIEPQ